LCQQIDDMRELLNDLLLRWEDLENKPTLPADWDGFLDQARALHERALLMRFKALERLQQGIHVPPSSEVVNSEAAEPDDAPFLWEAPAKVTTTPLEDSTAIEEQGDEPAEFKEDHGKRFGNDWEVMEADKEHYEVTEAAAAPQSPPASGVSLAEKLSLQPLKAILPALGINDRVRFAGVLFGGDMTQLQQACNAAESASNFLEAKAAIQALATFGLDWSDEAEAPFQFMQLVQRLHL
jgi:hypothetical protein